jgi:hypothetical protein
MLTSSSPCYCCTSYPNPFYLSAFPASFSNRPKRPTSMNSRPRGLIPFSNSFTGGNVRLRVPLLRQVSSPVQAQGRFPLGLLLSAAFSFPRDDEHTRDTSGMQPEERACNIVFGCGCMSPSGGGWIGFWGR